jgi:hypothetical protein
MFQKRWQQIGLLVQLWVFSEPDVWLLGNQCYHLVEIQETSLRLTRVLWEHDLLLAVSNRVCNFNFSCRVQLQCCNLRSFYDQRK